MTYEELDKKSVDFGSYLKSKNKKLEYDLDTTLLVNQSRKDSDKNSLESVSYLKPYNESIKSVIERLEEFFNKEAKGL